MFNRIYYWISAKCEGRLIVLGAYDSEDEANRIGYERLDIPFEVIPLNTRDMNRATRIIKARRLNSGNDNLEQALQRASHKT